METWGLPFQRAYWVRPGLLMAGCYPGSPDPAEASQKLKSLLDCGVRTFVNLMESHELDHSGRPFAGYEDLLRSLAEEHDRPISLASFPIKDLWIPTRRDMGRILDYIDAAIEKTPAVYVHCWGGRGRTGTIVGCYLARHGYAADGQVPAMIQRLRKNVEDVHLASPETNQQMDMVLSWVAGE